MTMENKIISLDPKDVLQLIFEEVNEALLMTAGQFVDHPAIRISSVRVRLGTDIQSAPQINGPPVSDSGTWINQPLQLDKPWIIEADMKPETVKMWLHSAAGDTHISLPEKEFDTTCFDHCDITIIQGIGPQWKRELAEIGIATVKELAGINEYAVAKFTKQFSSHQIIEFNAKARLIRTAFPYFPTSPADHKSLYDCAALSPEGLRKEIGKTSISLNRCRQLTSYLALLTMALDDKILKQTELAFLRSDFKNN